MDRRPSPGKIADAVDELLNSGDFDPIWYEQTYGDVRLSGLTAAEHYVRFGRLLGRPGSDGAVRPQPTATSAAAAPAGDVSFRGYLESTADGVLRGWAIRPTRSGQPVFVRACLDGVLLAEVPADRPRPDLQRIARDFDGGGFEIRLPYGRAGRPCTIDVTDRDTGTALRGSPAKAPLPADDGSGLDRAILHYRTAARARIAIVIPIHNAHDALKRCLESVSRNTTLDAQLILIDDCSTDPRIPPLLRAYRQATGASHLTNPRNLGFTATVNRGMREAPDADIVLLNSDTIVTPRWLEHLQFAAHVHPRAATATPLSNHAGAFSAPAIGVYNEPPGWLSSDGYGRRVSQASLATFPIVPTGNGFCMYIRRACLDEAGLFDEEAFPRGYGEENDFCMRAFRRGFRHVIDDRTLILHERSASFGEEKQALSKSGREVVNRRYPEYGMLTPMYRNDPCLITARHRVANALERTSAAAVRGEPRFLYVLSTRTGGTPQTNEDLMSALSGIADTWTLRCNSRELILSRYRDGHHEVVEQLTLENSLTPMLHRSDEYDRVVARWIVDYAFELVHIRHVSWHGLGLLEVCNDLNIPTIFSFHDFYTVCPTVNLVDAELRYCGGKCTPSSTECPVELWPPASMPPVKHRWIGQWQTMMRQSLQRCAAFITTAHHVRETITGNYPELGEHPFHVVPHGRSFAAMQDLSGSPQLGRRVRLLFPGNIGRKKGSAIIRELHDLDREARFEFHILGLSQDDALQGSRIIHHGPYERDQFSDLVAGIGPHFGCVFSLCPETYCHTLTELWACGLPVIGFDIGAVAERIDASGAGWLLDPLADAPALLARIRSLADSRDEYQEKAAAVRRWQTTSGSRDSVEHMASRYVDIYRSVIARRRPFDTGEPSRRPRVAVVTWGNPATGIAPGSVHVRLWERCRNDLERAVHYVRVAFEQLASPAYLETFDAIVVQRNCIPHQDVERFVTACETRGIPLLLDLDDDLLQVPPEKDPAGTYLEARPALEHVIRHASRVTVSTEELRQRIRPLNARTELLQNRLSEPLWFGPIDAGTVSTPELPDSMALRVLYMGSDTHGEDLDLLEEPFRQLAREGLPIELHVIGGEATSRSWYRRLDIPGDRRNYPGFVSWFRQVAMQFDLAVGPLADTPFNACKSGLKLLEYSAAGLVGLYSDVPAYRDLVTTGGPGRLVANLPADWYQALEDTVRERDRLRSRGAAALTWAREHWGLADGMREFDHHVLDTLDDSARSAGQEGAGSRLSGGPPAA